MIVLRTKIYSDDDEKPNHLKRGLKIGAGVAAGTSLAAAAGTYFGSKRRGKAALGRAEEEFKKAFDAYKANRNDDTLKAMNEARKSRVQLRNGIGAGSIAHAVDSKVKGVINDWKSMFGKGKKRHGSQGSPSKPSGDSTTTTTPETDS